MPYIVAIALFLGALMTPGPGQAADSTVTSGAYDEMLIGFNPATRHVTGFFSSETGGGQFTCVFYLTGTLRGPRAGISTYFPETPADDVIKGRLLLVGPTQIEVRLPSEHGGCWNVQHFADKSQPARFTLDVAHPWTAIAVVRATRAYFFDNADAKTRRRGYLVGGDGVGVRAVQRGWLQVDYVSGGKPVSGWIRQSDVYPMN